MSQYAALCIIAISALYEKMILYSETNIYLKLKLSILSLTSMLVYGIILNQSLGINSFNILLALITVLMSPTPLIICILAGKFARRIIKTLKKLPRLIKLRKK